MELSRQTASLPWMPLWVTVCLGCLHAALHRSARAFVHVRNCTKLSAPQGRRFPYVGEQSGFCSAQQGLPRLGAHVVCHFWYAALNVSSPCFLLICSRLRSQGAKERRGTSSSMGLAELRLRADLSWGCRMEFMKAASTSWGS